MKTVADLTPTRRDLLRFGGMGLALAGVDGVVPRSFGSTGYKAKPRGTAKNVIYYEISGAIAHTESFDFKETAGTPKDLDIGATLRWELGRAVLEQAASTPSERAEALALARAAQDQFRAFDDAAMVAEIAAFLDHCGRRCADGPEIP